MSIVQPIGPSWPYHPVVPTVPPQGYTCALCGAWVQYGWEHDCTKRNTTTTFVLKGWEEAVSDHEVKQLAEIVDALEKARSAFGGLADDTDKGVGNRVAAYLSARFGVKESALIDVLLEES